MNVTVKFFSLDASTGRQVEAGSISWDGNKIVADGDRSVQVTATLPITVYRNRKPIELVPADGEVFVRGLSEQYRGSYFRASDVIEDQI
jgi:hypothetical protein